ncbi:DUF4240 domain-containing protein [Duganella sp. sic0402]|uniref:DUF4240 domain-containing protein n=1 Tax=Duganella sp. sic0402 TaxID=2854786 RepID=UPI001C46C02D|nr:DUF4240 domain-containing protein [Duganella sp. sic0402]MBV7534239.1 DUF4240 domain-containing protein [Duganella sp. sic0402]
MVNAHPNARRRTVLLAFSLIALRGHSAAATATISPMNERQFWALVGAVKTEAGVDIDTRPALLQKRLLALTPAAIQGFQKRYEALLVEANSWMLWGAAVLMADAYTDDGFKYFRDWLISEGEQTYKQAVLNPDTLARLPPRNHFSLESFGYAALKAYAAKGAGELERDFNIEFAVTSGDEVSSADLPKRLPALFAKYRRG